MKSSNKKTDREIAQIKFQRLILNYLEREHLIGKKNHNIVFKKTWDNGEKKQESFSTPKSYQAAVSEKHTSCQAWRIINVKFLSASGGVKQHSTWN